MTQPAPWEELPTLQEELERKTVETLQWIVSMSMTGQMSPGEVKVAIQTVFSTVAGLASKETMDMLSLAEADSKAQSVIRRVFTNAGSPKLFVVTWRVGEREFVVTSQSLQGDKAIKEQKYQFADPLATSERFRALCEQLKTAYGLTEIQ